MWRAVNQRLRLAVAAGFDGRRKQSFIKSPCTGLSGFHLQKPTGGCVACGLELLKANVLLNEQGTFGLLFLFAWLRSD